ncbi:iron complex transport system substrate-binding protein [Promicromonospora sp. AC04]|uniref:heme/hemin ABC transporter substrate-binding protein n=1 Tax=Promicromonospora sp. AC04 TaxID=2135723 RepID=UPI000D3B8AC0|nr:ABC transporter substrate-binding protein [Promicromonospora sp. AC04]PUB24964.1 iron complex transport system substrate-binding protein [Promicromonospora sp. AC04]
MLRLPGAGPDRAAIPMWSRRPARTARPTPSARAHKSLVASVLVTAVALVAGCGLQLPQTGHTSDDGAVVGTQPLSELEPIADPRSWTGEITVGTAERPVDPVAENPEPALPATVTDAQGTEVTVTDTSRILALDLYGSLSRIVFELGLGENVVGRDVSSGFPEIAARPIVTSNGHELTGEAILDLAPTVILTDTTLGPWDVVLQMRDAGIPVVVLDSHRSLETSADLARATGEALGLPAEGAALAERTTDAVDATLEQIAGLAPTDPRVRPRVIFLYVRGQSGVYYLFGDESGADSLIEGLGAVDAAGEVGWKGMRPLNDEGLISMQPDLVLLMTGGLESVGGVDGLLEQVPALAQTPAGENRRFVAMDDTEILSFGPASADVLDALARAFYAPDSLS